MEWGGIEGNGKEKKRKKGEKASGGREGEGCVMAFEGMDAPFTNIHH